MNANKISFIVVALAIAFCVYEIASGVFIAQKTGVLQVQSADPNATVTLSQLGKQPINLALPIPKLRLEPGSYMLIASDGKSQSTETTVITAQETIGVLLPKPVSTLPSIPQNVTVSNNLINNLLPFIGPGFSWKVGYKYTFNASYAMPIIVITAPTRATQQSALAWIKAQGYDLSMLTISYITAQP